MAAPAERNIFAPLLTQGSTHSQSTGTASTDRNVFASLAGLPPVLPQQGGMTPWRAATANPVEDLQANLAANLNRQLSQGGGGLTMPVNQQHVEPETVAQAQAALTQDPAGLAANVLQGVTLHGAGYLSPEIKRRAESYAGMYPTAAPLAQIAGGAVPSIITGGAADWAAAPLAARPLLQALVRYAPSTVLGGVQSAVNTPEGATPTERLVNTLIGGGTGAGGQALSDMSGNVVNRLGTGRMPTMRPVVRPLVTGAAKTGAVAGLAVPAAYGMHHVVPWSEGALGLLPFFHDVRGAMLSGPKDIGTGLLNLARNAYGTLSTPTGPARVGGRFAPGAYAPPRTAIPAAIAAPYAAGATTPSWLAQLIAEWNGDQTQQQP